jgi:hypothetical protein
MSRYGAPPDRLGWQRIGFFLCAVFIAAYFAYFTSVAFTARFNGDDMMNIENYWRTDLWKLVTVQFAYFTNSYRPLGAVFYLPLYKIAHLNPLPYHVAAWLIAGLNVWLAYRCGFLLSGSKLAGGLTALFISYHPKLIAIVYSTGVIYDVLCFSFYFLAFNRYLEVRREGRLPRASEWLWIIVFYICCMNAKEMAVTLPVAMLTYELITHPPRAFTWTSILDWAKSQGRCAIVLGILTIPYVVGKFFGSGAMVRNEAYRPVLSVERFLASNSFFVGSLSFHSEFFNARNTLLFWLVLAAAGWIRRSPALRFASIFVIFSTLPIAFIEPRGEYAFYITLFGYALALASLLTVCMHALARPALGTFAARAAPVLLLGCVLVLFVREVRQQSANALNDLRAAETVPWSTIQDFTRLRPNVRPGSQIMFLGNPFPQDQWDLVFIADLWFGDHSLTFWMQDKQHLPANEVADKDYIFDFQDGHLVQLKPR